MTSSWTTVFHKQFKFRKQTLLLVPGHQGPLLLAQINLNPSMDKLSHPLSSVGQKCLHIHSHTSMVLFKSGNEMSNFIPHFTGHMITYPCQDHSWPMIVKGTSELSQYCAKFCSDNFETTEKMKYKYSISTLRPRQNGHNFPDDIFNYISFNENLWIWNFTEVCS